MKHLLPLLPKPSRYTGIEPGAVHKTPETVLLRVALAFPDTYEVGMSYLGQKILYAVVNANPAWHAERVFAPELENAAVLRKYNAPLCTLETDTPLAHTDVVGFSVTHELCYSNIVYMLDLAGIPLYAAQRAQEPGKWPLIIAGGGCTLSGEPIAPFFDLMFLGEGEDAAPEFFTLLESAKRNGTLGDRENFLRAAAAIPGIYVPEFFTQGNDGRLLPRFPDLLKPTRRIVPDMDSALYPVSQVTPFGAIHNRLSVEIGRGCTRGCRFCQAGMTARPVRERSVAVIQSLVDSRLSRTGYSELSFLSLSSGDFSALKTLFLSCTERCAAEEVAISLPSLRVGSIDDKIMTCIADIRRTGATLAPEAGSQRLRDVINKGVTEAALIRHVQKLFEHGWQRVKLYFMIGLPTETDEDLEAIVALCRKARDSAGPGIKRLQITAAVSPFVPKPHTPFQWEAQLSLEELRRRIGVLRTALKKEHRITMRWHDPEASFLEGIFSRGDRRLAPVLERAFRAGAVFDNWHEHFSLTPWLEAMTAEKLRPEEYTGARSPNMPLPWDHLENGCSVDFLLRERQRAFCGNTSDDCRYEHCLACGACDTKNTPSRLHKLPGAGAYIHMLNQPQRDQDSHEPSLDQYGRVIVRATHEDKQKNSSSGTQGQKRPPSSANSLLAVKAAHFRIWHTKNKLAVFLSQLELQSLFAQAFRRAALPLSFSQGFHPLPLFSFSRALPVGVASEAEYLTVYLREWRDAAQVREALGIIIPGLEVYKVECLPVGKRPPDPVQEHYLLEYLDREQSSREFIAAWRQFAATATFPWLRDTKKGQRALDARAYFSAIAPIDDHGIKLSLSWESGYVSPLTLVSFVMSAMGCAVDLSAFRLTKTA